MDTTSTHKNLSWAAMIGIAITIVWLGYVVFLVATQFDHYQAMDLNEKGDFLAGVGGPVALMWLVIGFFQQSSALRLQQKELKHQVEETRRLVEQSALQGELKAAELDFAKQYKHQEAQPRFVMQKVSTAQGATNCKISNLGASVTDVVMKSRQMYNEPLQVAVWGHGENRTITFTSLDCSADAVEFTYFDADGKHQYLAAIVTSDFTLNTESVDLFIERTDMSA